MKNKCSITRAFLHNSKLLPYTDQENSLCEKCPNTEFFLVTVILLILTCLKMKNQAFRFSTFIGANYLVIVN